MRNLLTTVIGPVLLLMTTLAMLNSAAASAMDTSYRVIETLHLSGPVRWDYLTIDPARQRLFVTRGDRVDVVDLKTKTLVGSITNTQGVHGVALAPDLGRGFTSNGAANSSIVFDLTTLKPLETIKTGIKPDAIVYDLATKRVFTANGQSADLTAIDGEKGVVVSTIKLGGRPEFAVVDGRGHLYVDIVDRSQVVVINTRHLAVEANYDVAPQCQGPTGISIDRQRQRLFVSCHNQVMVVVAAETGKIVSVLPIGQFSDATVFDAEQGLAFSSNSDGTLTMVDAKDPHHYSVLQSIMTAPGARTMALDPNTHRLYLATAEIDHIDPPTAARPHPHLQMKPDTFMILTVAPAGTSERQH
ncbi:MAG: YncE family protein [Sulfuricaulis sp.]